MLIRCLLRVWVKVYVFCIVLYSFRRFIFIISLVGERRLKDKCLKQGSIRLTLQYRARELEKVRADEEGSLGKLGLAEAGRVAGGGVGLGSEEGYFTSGISNSGSAVIQFRSSVLLFVSRSFGEVIKFFIFFFFISKMG